MAEQLRGYRNEMTIGFEASYGVPGDMSRGVKMPFNTEALAISRAKNTAATLRGTRNPAEPFDGNTDVAGDIVVPVGVSGFGYWLRAMFGAPVTSALEEPEGDAAYQHIFTPGEDLPSLWIETLFKADTPFYKRSLGCKISSFSMDVGGDGELTASLSMMGGKQTQEAAPLDADAADAPFLRLNNFAATLKVDGVEYGDATSFSISLDNGLDGDTYTIGGGGFRGALPEGLLGVSGSMAVLLKDSELYKKALASTPMSMQLVIAHPSGPSLAFDFSHVQLQVTGPVTDGPAGLRLTWNYQAYSPLPDDPAIVVTLKNAVENYNLA